MFREKYVYKPHFMTRTPIMQTCNFGGNSTEVHSALELLRFIAHISSF
jgi:hypothetical protein